MSMGKDKKKRSGGKKLRIVPAAIVARDTGLVSAAKAAMGDPNFAGSPESYIAPPTIQTAVDCGVTRLIRGVVGEIPLGKWAGNKITML